MASLCHSISETKKGGKEVKLTQARPTNPLNIRRRVYPQRTNKQKYPQLPNHSKGHNQHSLLSVGLTVWKSSLNDECNCVPDFIQTSKGIASRYADDGIIYFLCSPLLPHRTPPPCLPPTTGTHRRCELTGSSDCISTTLAGAEGSEQRKMKKDSWKKMTFKRRIHR